MTQGTMKINVNQRFDGECKVYAFDVVIDGRAHREVSKWDACKLILQAEDVARELRMDLNVYGKHYLVAA